MRDEKTTEKYRKEGGEIKHERVSVHVEKGGILAGDKYEDQGTGSRSDYYDLQIRDEQLKRLPERPNAGCDVRRDQGHGA
jgi:hypothetical protein